MSINQIPKNEKIHVLLIGILPNAKDNEFLISRGIRPNPVGKVCQHIVDGLLLNPNVEKIHVVSSLRIKSYFRNKIFRIKSTRASIGNFETYESVGFINLPIIGFFSREIGIIQRARRWAKLNNDKKLLVLVYSMNSSFLNAAIQVKKLIPQSRVSVIVADLPLFMDMRSVLRRMLKEIDWKRILRMLKHVDHYCLYTKHMANYLQLPENKWILFEGLVGNDRLLESGVRYEDRKDVCIYAGNLDLRYGIDKLINAYSQLADIFNTQLHIYGSGDIENLNRK